MGPGGGRFCTDGQGWDNAEDRATWVGGAKGAYPPPPTPPQHLVGASCYKTQGQRKAIGEMWGGSRQLFHPQLWGHPPGCVCWASVKGLRASGCATRVGEKSLLSPQPVQTLLIQGTGCTFVSPWAQYSIQLSYTNQLSSLNSDHASKLPLEKPVLAHCKQKLEQIVRASGRKGWRVVKGTPDMQ